MSTQFNSKTPPSQPPIVLKINLPLNPTNFGVAGVWKNVQPFFTSQAMAPVFVPTLSTEEMAKIRAFRDKQEELRALNAEKAPEHQSWTEENRGVIETSLIDQVKATAGYTLYRKTIPWAEREPCNPLHPQTPRPSSCLNKVPNFLKAHEQWAHDLQYWETLAPKLETEAFAKEIALELSRRDKAEALLMQEEERFSKKTKWKQENRAATAMSMTDQVKATAGYALYVKTVPLEKRELYNPRHPNTPRLLPSCTVRRFLHFHKQWAHNLQYWEILASKEDTVAWNPEAFQKWMTDFGTDACESK